MRDYIGNLLKSKFQVTLVSSSDEVMQKLRGGLDPDLILLDLFVGGKEDVQALADIRSANPSAAIIALSCIADPQHIISVYRMGVKDVVMKPFTAWEFEQAIERVLKSSQLGKGNHEILLNDNVSFVHCSRKMQEVRAQCSLVARVDLPVLILGESGTGKEVIAEYIHTTSPRRSRTFLKVNCAAMPADLLESELFGYEQGAFTGAVKSKAGKFEICNNGTILLDEIGEMPPSLQAKLLHVLQDGTFSRLGSRTTQKVDVRVIAATNIDIKVAIAQRRFREDLYYRLNGFCVQLPPLRERKDEIPLLIEHFTRKVSEKYGSQAREISPLLMQACMQHDWPGNLRELENFVKRLVVLGDESMMLAELSPRWSTPVVARNDAPGSGLKRVAKEARGEAEAIAIARALEATAWNRKKAASELQISYKALLYKIKQYNLQMPVPVTESWNHVESLSRR
jgi:two-component system response regulator AtoC